MDLLRALEAEVGAAEHQDGRDLAHARARARSAPARPAAGSTAACSGASPGRSGSMIGSSRAGGEPHGRSDGVTAVSSTTTPAALTLTSRPPRRCRRAKSQRPPLTASPMSAPSGAKPLRAQRARPRRRTPSSPLLIEGGAAVRRLPRGSVARAHGHHVRCPPPDRRCSTRASRDVSGRGSTPVVCSAGWRMTVRGAAAESWRASRVGPDPGAEDVEEGGGAFCVVEVELDDDVAVVVDRLADAMGDHSAIGSELFGAVERRPPLLVVGDRMFDVQGRHPTIVRPVTGRRHHPNLLGPASRVASRSVGVLERIDTICRASRRRT